MIWRRLSVSITIWEVVGLGVYVVGRFAFGLFWP